MEPLPFRRSGFSPDYAATTARILVTDGSTRAYASGFYAVGTPPYRIAFRRPGVSAAGLSPVHFRRPGPRLVSCYALFKGWLLLSLPPSCLRPGTSFGVTLSRHLGALTPVWVVPLADTELTPVPRLRPSTAAVDSEFGRGAGVLPPAPPISALPHRLPPGGSYCGMFRGEPAIPGLDWTFTPRRGSGERFAHQHPCGPPRRFRAASPCPRLDRPASGRTAGTIGRAHPAPRP